VQFPALAPRPRSRETLDAFAGYNHNLRIGENEFYDMQNLTSRRFPVLSVRPARGLYGEGLDVRAMVSRDGLCYIDGSCLVINGYRAELGLVGEGPRQLVSMGAYLIILPDKKYFNTADFSDFGNIEAEFTAQSPVTFTPCQADGTPYKPDYIQPQQPEAPENMALWVDTSREPHGLKQYSAAMDLWTGIETVYIKLSCPGIGAAFSQYDGVTLTGLGELENSQLRDLEGASHLYFRQEDAVVVPGMLDGEVTVEAPVTLSRKMPAMDFLIESGNRLWGCRYGPNNAGQVVNELYACALGDFRNWNSFLGISSDSYYVSLGADGPFTGAIAHGGHPLFFRENCLHKVYGQIPANFSVQTTPCRGVRKDCAGSLAIVNEILYYLSAYGVCAYDGSLPVEVSAALGEQQFEKAVAAAYGSRYYISMQHRGTHHRSLFVYDTYRGLWHREDDLQVTHFCACREELYCATEDGKILALQGSGEPWEKSVPWMLETGILGGSLPEKKYLVKLSLELSLDPGSRVDIYVRYDSRGEWISLGHITGRELRSFTIPVRPRRCGHLQLRLEGTGYAALHSMTKTYSQGSDV